MQLFYCVLSLLQSLPPAFLVATKIIKLLLINNHTYNQKLYARHSNALLSNAVVKADDE